MAAFAVLATAIRLGYVLAAASDEENCLLQAGAHKLTAHRGINIVAADRGEIQMADWLKKECYPGAEAGHLWHTWGDRVRPCVGQITDGEIQALEQSQHFCPHARGQESESAREQGGQNWCQRDGNLADQTCIYQANGIFDQKASEAAAPGLYAEYAEMRYGDPLYAYPPGSDLEKANAPRSPAFINVNQLYEDGQDKMIIWAGQCPLEGPELETNLPKEKHANVCSWLGFIKEKGVKLLISLAPNPAEIAESNSKPRCHDYVLDMTNKVKAAQLQCTGHDYQATILESLPFFIASGDQANISRRSVKFDGHEFQQLYFDAWPDAHGSENPAVPVQAAIERIMDLAKQYDKIVIHCAGGRGRTGTVALALIQQAEGQASAHSLVQLLVRLRERRADLIEHPTQLMLLGSIFGLGSEQCQLTEGTA